MTLQYHNALGPQRALGTHPHEREVAMILVGDEISEYAITGRIDLARSRALRRPVLLLDHVGAV